MKAKNNSPQAVRNRNNRKRGASFEKNVADILDMEVVPYSGSNSRFGWSDVRDSESKNDALWMGECKNITIEDGDPWVIKNEWIVKMEERAYATGALPFLAFMRKGKPSKYVLINERTRGILEATIGRPLEINRRVIYPMKSCKSVNIPIDQFDLDRLKNFKYMGVRLGDNAWYYVMHLTSFKELLGVSNMHMKWR